jgi:hypothetical protein
MAVIRLLLVPVLAFAVSAGAPRPALAQAGSGPPASSPPTPSPAETDAEGARADQVAAVRAEFEGLRLEFEALRQQYDQRLLALEERLAQLGGGPAVPPAEPALEPVARPGQPAPGDAAEPAEPAALVLPAAEPVAPQQPLRTSAQVFNPDTSVIANFLTTAGENPVHGDEPPFSLEEVEIAFQAIVDPFARADVYVAAGHDGVEIEEGFVTFTTLPANLLLKAGKMRAQFGKLNLLHTHNVPGADRPLVSENLLGGHDGFADAGLSLSHLVQNPAVFLELTGEVYAGDSNVFRSDARSRLNYLGRVRAYRDLTEASNLDLGASFAFGPGALEAGDHDLDHEEEIAPGHDDDVEALTAFDKRLVGIDATFRYRPLRGALYRRLNLRTELIWSTQDLPEGGATTAFGFFGLGEYQFARRWFVGGRVDRSGRPFDGSAIDTGGAVFLTFWPSEYSLLRGEYRRINYFGGATANEFLFQLNFSIGAHGAHVF